MEGCWRVRQQQTFPKAKARLIPDENCRQTTKTGAVGREQEDRACRAGFIVDDCGNAIRIVTEL
jgi:hypothetical protein